MPLYEYRCRKGHTFEAMQRMSDEPLTTCTECRSSVQRVFHPVAVHFKGSGFYTTDYGRKRSGEGSETQSKDGSDTKKDAGSKKDKEKKGASSSGATDK